MTEDSRLAIVHSRLEESARVKRQVATDCAADIAAAAERIAATFEGGGKVLLCGNGGSAADCQHIAAEFVSVLNHQRPRPGLPAIALTTDTSFLTASSNDFGFTRIFARQVESLGARGDLLIGISTSGTSANVVAAFEEARARGLHRIAFTGRSEGPLSHAADIAIRVPSTVTQHVQEAHIAIAHVICELVERSLFPRLYND